MNHSGGQECPPSASEEFENFQTWLKSVSPNMTWDWRHQIYLYERLQRVTDGTSKRLMIFMPPRHGKSELVTVRYSAWRMRRNPAMKIILASYGQQLANTFSRSIKRVLCDDAALSAPGAVADGSTCAKCKSAQPKPNQARLAGRTNETRDSEKCNCKHLDGQPRPPSTAGGTDITKMFPFTSQRPINTAAQWGTAVGGGLRAVGVGGGVTGFGADLIVIDDPVKNRVQAESETYRDRVWEWYNDDLYTRLEPNGSLVLIQTRWHEDDLAGRLIKRMNEGGDQWEIVDLPALAIGPDLDGLTGGPELAGSEPGGIATGLPNDLLRQARDTQPSLIETDRKVSSPFFPASGERDGANQGRCLLLSWRMNRRL